MFKSRKGCLWRRGRNSWNDFSVASEDVTRIGGLKFKSIIAQHKNDFILRSSIVELIIG